MPIDKSLFSQEIDRLSLSETGKTAEQSRLGLVSGINEINQISIFQDHLSGRLKTKLENEILKLKQNNLTLENNIAELKVEISICDTKLMNQKVIFYFFNISFLLIIVVLIYKSFILFKNRQND